ncbi:filament-like plant protein 7 [Oryza brachyantha]|uniref:Filament-like plant protein 7 n=1 Tax=Oryza brachyantha TaxID=4533 RepID=J3LER4_ORYBR|nr:filament-like plant protein 7 [Oryza brachyantha]
MSEMEGALRSCMEQLLIAREEREQIIVEAASEISSEKKKSRELQRKLDAATKKAAKLAAENGSLAKAIDAKDAAINELKGSKSASDGELAGARAKLDAAQKQSASLQYEVRMLQKELEIRSQEREYDHQSADAAGRQQAESQKKIAQLEGECQRLRAMVRKRLPGPAAIAKMRDEVDQPAAGAPATPRRSRSVAPMSPRSVAAPMTPRSTTPMSARPMSPMSARPMTPRRAPPEHETNTAKLHAVEEENKALKQALAKRDAELQFVQMKYADEACKLSVVQRQLSELSEENKQLSDAHGQTESWASALISELEQFRASKQGAASEMSLLDDFAEIERLEMASGGQGLKPSGASPKNVHSQSVLSEKNGKDSVQENGISNGQNHRDTVLENGISNGQPEWVQDMCKLVMQKHESSGEKVETILELITRALDQSSAHQKGDALDGSYDWTRVKEMVSSLTEEVTCAIGISAGSNVASSEQLLLDKSEFSARLQQLVHVCHDLLNGKANLEKFVDEVCLILEYIVNQYKSISYQEQSDDTVDKNTENLDGDGSLSSMNGGCDIKSPESAAVLDIQTEEHKQSIQSVQGQKTDEERQLDEELTRVILDQDEKISQENSTCCEIESPPAHPTAESVTDQEEKQLISSSDISAAAEKLAECQETITNLSRQLLALKSPAVSGNLDSSISNSRPSSAKSEYKPQSLASILAEGEDTGTEGSGSPATKELHSKKDPDAAASRKSVTKDGSATQTVVLPILPEPSQQTISPDLKKKKRSPSLLGRMIFRKKVEGS